MQVNQVHLPRRGRHAPTPRLTVTCRHPPAGGRRTRLPGNRGKGEGVGGRGKSTLRAGLACQFVCPLATGLAVLGEPRCMAR